MNDFKNFNGPLLTSTAVRLVRLLEALLSMSRQLPLYAKHASIMPSDAGVAFQKVIDSPMMAELTKIASSPLVKEAIIQEALHVQNHARLVSLVRNTDLMALIQHEFGETFVRNTTQSSTKRSKRVDVEAVFETLSQPKVLRTIESIEDAPNDESESWGTPEYGSFAFAATAQAKGGVSSDTNDFLARETSDQNNLKQIALGIGIVYMFALSLGVLLPPTDFGEGVQYMANQFWDVSKLTLYQRLGRSFKSRK